MKKVLSYGSLNLDNVYSVPHFVKEGETLSSTSFEIHCGGKGLNQSIAMARAGARVYHAGAIGSDGLNLMKLLQKDGVNTSLIYQSEQPTGHAIIQRDEKGQNCILINGGANQAVRRGDIDHAFSLFENGDYIVLQNEINDIGYIMKTASQKGLKIVMNPSPMNDIVLTYPLNLVDILLLNEIEGAQISGIDRADQMLFALQKRFPHAAIVLTLGEKGVQYIDPSLSTPLIHSIYEIPVIDTTAAGDTFTGYFVACMILSIETVIALHIASIAAALAVSRKGAASSIPFNSEVMAVLEMYLRNA